MMKVKYYQLFLCFILSVSCIKDKEGDKIKIENKLESSRIIYAIDRLEEELQINNPFDKNITIKTRIDENNLKSEAYRINSEEDVVELVGGDDLGVMYGLLEIKEQIKYGNKTIQNKTESPRLPFRAIKFNLPWSTYRNGESLSLHYETCKDTLYWKSFLDMMVENRFNKLTLWNLHPFSYLVKTEKYPEANNFSEEEMRDWEMFWHALFTMAKDRGIETYLVNWNIFVSPEFAKAHNVATHSISNKHFFDGDTSEIIKDYTRETVKAVIDKYPNLTGLGITLGEGMGGMTPAEREQWLLDAYIAGARMASRKIKFIHRVPLSANKKGGGSASASVEKMTRQTLDTLTCFDGPMNIELKFNWSHAHSTPYLAKVHGGKLTDAYWNPMPKNYRLAWMMRNEDFFMLRWGQSDFIKQHIDQNAHDYVNGYFVGSECYIPAKDYITKLEGTSYQYGFQRQWMFYKNWGRLLYNPKTSDKVFINAFVNKFPKHGKALFEAQQRISKVPLIYASYMNATWDFTLYSEGLLYRNKERKMQLITVQELCRTEPMEPKYIGIQEFLVSSEKDYKNRITPIQLADAIQRFCNKALKQVEQIKTDNNVNVDLIYEVSDIKAWAHIGLHFADKLKAAVAYQQFLNTDNKTYLEEAVDYLVKGKTDWEKLIEVTSSVYNPVPLIHYGGKETDTFHWANLLSEIQDEIDWLKQL